MPLFSQEHKLQARHVIKTSAAAQLRQEIRKAFPTLTRAQLDLLLPHKARPHVDKLANGCFVYGLEPDMPLFIRAPPALVGGAYSDPTAAAAGAGGAEEGGKGKGKGKGGNKPELTTAEGGGVLMPTVIALQKVPTLLPPLFTHQPVAQRMMAPAPPALFKGGLWLPDLPAEFYSHSSSAAAAAVAGAKSFGAAIEAGAGVEAALAALDVASAAAAPPADAAGETVDAEAPASPAAEAGEVGSSAAVEAAKAAVDAAMVAACIHCDDSDDDGDDDDDDEDGGSALPSGSVPFLPPLWPSLALPSAPSLRALYSIGCSTPLAVVALCPPASTTALLAARAAERKLGRVAPAPSREAPLHPVYGRGVWGDGAGAVVVHSMGDCLVKPALGKVVKLAGECAAAAAAAAAAASTNAASTGDKAKAWTSRPVLAAAVASAATAASAAGGSFNSGLRLAPAGNQVVIAENPHLWSVFFAASREMLGQWVPRQCLPAAGVASEANGAVDAENDEAEDGAPAEPETAEGEARAEEEGEAPEEEEQEEERWVPDADTLTLRAEMSLLLAVARARSNPLPLPMQDSTFYEAHLRPCAQSLTVGRLLGLPQDQAAALARVPFTVAQTEHGKLPKLLKTAEKAGFLSLKPVKGGSLVIKAVDYEHSDVLAVAETLTKDDLKQQKSKPQDPAAAPAAAAAAASPTGAAGGTGPVGVMVVEAVRVSPALRQFLLACCPAARQDALIAAGACGLAWAPPKAKAEARFEEQFPSLGEGGDSDSEAEKGRAERSDADDDGDDDKEENADEDDEYYATLELPTVLGPSGALLYPSRDAPPLLRALLLRGPAAAASFAWVSRCVAEYVKERGLRCTAQGVHQGQGQGQERGSKGGDPYPYVRLDASLAAALGVKRAKSSSNDSGLVLLSDLPKLLTKACTPAYALFPALLGRFLSLALGPPEAAVGPKLAAATGLSSGPRLRAPALPQKVESATAKALATADSVAELLPMLMAAPGSEGAFRLATSPTGVDGVVVRGTGAVWKCALAAPVCVFTFSDGPRQCVGIDGLFQWGVREAAVAAALKTRLGTSASAAKGIVWVQGGEKSATSVVKWLVEDMHVPPQSIVSKERKGFKMPKD